MKRKRDWPTHLEKILRRSKKRRFIVGKHDCVLFVCDCIKSMTSVDPAKEFRSQYKTKEEANTLLKQYAGGGVAKAWSKYAQTNNLDEIPVGMASRGDVALVHTENGETLSIVDLSGRNLLLVAPKGLVSLPIAHATHAWRIG